MSHELIPIEAGIIDTAGGKGDVGWVNASTPVVPSITPRRKKRSRCCR
jgi:hypothetical protein